MIEATLFIVCGSNASDGKWKQYIIAQSPGEAVNIATKRKSWTVGEPITVDMPIDFVDARQAFGSKE